MSTTTVGRIPSFPCRPSRHKKGESFIAETHRVFPVESAEVKADCEKLALSTPNSILLKHVYHSNCVQLTTADDNDNCASPIPATTIWADPRTRGAKLQDLEPLVKLSGYSHAQGLCNEALYLRFLEILNMRLKVTDEEFLTTSQVNLFTDEKIDNPKR